MNKWVLRANLTFCTVHRDILNIFGGNSFQSNGPACANDQSPYNLLLLGTSKLVFEERRRLGGLQKWTPISFIYKSKCYLDLFQCQLIHCFVRLHATFCCRNSLPFFKSFPIFQVFSHFSSLRDSSWWGDQTWNPDLMIQLYGKLKLKGLNTFHK